MRIGLHLEHYIVETQKHAVFGPFSNEAGEKSSICGLKASARFNLDTKKAPKPEVSGASLGTTREKKAGRLLEGQRAAAADFDRLASDPARFRTGKEGDDVGDVVGLADALQRLVAEGKSLTSRNC